MGEGFSNESKLESHKAYLGDGRSPAGKGWTVVFLNSGKRLEI